MVPLLNNCLITVSLICCLFCPVCPNHSDTTVWSVLLCPVYLISVTALLGPSLNCIAAVQSFFVLSCLSVSSLCHCYAVCSVLSVLSWCVTLQEFLCLIHVHNDGDPVDGVSKTHLVIRSHTFKSLIVP